MGQASKLRSHSDLDDGFRLMTGTAQHGGPWTIIIIINPQIKSEIKISRS